MGMEWEWAARVAIICIAMIMCVRSYIYRRLCVHCTSTAHIGLSS